VLRIQEDDKPFQVQLSDESFETYELDPPPYTLDTTKKELKQMYYDMVSIRYALYTVRRIKWQAD
jgi:pyruvate dehydrogenase E1 component alpha subunit